MLIGHQPKEFLLAVEGLTVSLRLVTKLPSPKGGS